MKNYILYLLISTFLILLGIESLSFIILKLKSKEKSFLFQRIIDNDGFKEYKIIDPLLGWAISKEDVVDKELNVEHNCVVLNSIDSDSSPLKIYISGGSTSDST